MLTHVVVEFMMAGEPLLHRMYDLPVRSSRWTGRYLSTVTPSIVRVTSGCSAALYGRRLWPRRRRWRMHRSATSRSSRSNACRSSPHDGHASTDHGRWQCSHRHRRSAWWWLTSRITPRQSVHRRWAERMEVVCRSSRRSRRRSVNPTCRRSSRCPGRRTVGRKGCCHGDLSAAHRRPNQRPKYGLSQVGRTTRTPDHQGRS